MSRVVLCVNLGSRTAKLTLLAVDAGARLGEPAAPLAVVDVAIEAMHDPAAFGELDVARADVVAYRVVRTSGIPHSDAVPFDEAARRAIGEAEELAPLHVRPVLAARAALGRSIPRAVHVAVFDSAFHRTIADHVAAYGLPYDDFTHGWRKIGFHGLSHGYAAARVATLLGDAAPRRKLVSAHLGGGASLAAIAGARSVDTTMGFTPLDGLLMTTRSGALDPGLLLAYMRRNGLDAAAAEELLSSRSGLLGLSGSDDMRAIVAAAERGDARARFAYDVFVYRLVTRLGAMIAALGGLEALAFLGGIGENAAPVRADACAPLAFAGVALDTDRNRGATDDALISSPSSRVPVFRIHTREDWAIALAATASA